jgi:hypothetical protein
VYIVPKRQVTPSKEFCNAGDYFDDILDPRATSHHRVHEWCVDSVRKDRRRRAIKNAHLECLAGLYAQDWKDWGYLLSWEERARRITNEIEAEQRVYNEVRRHRPENAVDLRYRDDFTARKNYVWEACRLGLSVRLTELTIPFRILLMFIEMSKHMERRAFPFDSRLRELPVSITAALAAWEKEMFDGQ